MSVDAVASDTGREADPGGAAHVRGSSLLLVGRLISVAINLGTQALIARQLVQTEFGAFALAFAIAGVGQVAITLGLHRGATHFFALYLEGRAPGRLIGAIILNVGVIVGLGAILIAMVAVGQRGLTASGLLDPTATALLLLLVFLAPIDALDDLLIGLFAVFDSPRSIFVRRYVLAPVLRFGVAALLVFADGDAVQLAVGYLATGLFGVGLYGALFIRLLQRKGIVGAGRRDRIEVPVTEMLGFSIPLLSNDVVWLLINTFPIIVLTAASGLDEVAAYQVVRPAAALNLLVATSFYVLYLPMASRFAARDDLAGASQLYWRTAIWVAVMTFPVFAATFALGRPLASAMFGELYEPSGLYLSVLSVGYLVHAALGFNGTTLAAHGHHRIVAVANGAAASVSVAGALLLIPPYGALGAAVAATGTLLVQNALLQLALRRWVGIALLDREALRVYGVLAAAAGALLAVESFGSLGLWALGLAAIASLLVFYLARGATQVDTLFPEIQPLIVRLLALTGRPGRRLAAGVDLLRTTPPRVAWSRWRVSRRWAAQDARSRVAIYRQIWTEAASALGASITSVGADSFEIRVNDRRVVVADHALAIDHPSVLELALDKPAVNRILVAHGLPVPEQLAFAYEEFERAAAFLAAVGGPCVVKPARGRTGSGVTTMVRTRSDLLRAIVRAGGDTDRLVIERQIGRRVYRLLFLDGRLLDVLERMPPRVVGDGRSSIAMLIQATNETRLAAHGRAGLSMLKVDLDCLLTLASSGMSLASIPAAGTEVVVKTATNQNGAGDNRSVLGEVGEDLVARALEAASLIGVRLAGVDVMTEDPAVSLAAAGGVILEINGLPGIHYHYLVRPDTASQAVAVPILECLLLADSATGVVVVEATSGLPIPIRDLDHAPRANRGTPAILGPEGQP